MSSFSRSGAQVLVDQLLLHGVDTAFCVPGESYLALLDALHDVSDRIRLITCRHEAGAANMAEAYGKLTGKPGLCLVTRGPGATQASVGLHTAFQDSTPLLLLVGQVQREALGREAFQEVRHENLFQEVSKWTQEIQDPQRLPEFLARAFHVAQAGRPGPVVLALPQDMLTESCTVADARPVRQTAPEPGVAVLRELRERLDAAQRPMLIVGGPHWSEAARENLEQFASRWKLPVATSFRCQDRIDNRHPCYAGELGTSASARLNQRIQEADLLLVLGARLGEMTTQGYTLLQIPVPEQTLVQVHPDPDELNTVYQADLPVAVSAPSMVAALASWRPDSTPVWQPWQEELHHDYQAHVAVPELETPLNLAAAVQTLRKQLPADTIFTNGAGNYAAWANRFSQFFQYPTQVAPTSGAMGYGLPAALAAKVCHPDRAVVCFAGDGCFLMAANELATAVQYDLAVVVVVVNNGMYGTIRAHQERHYPGRVHGTSLRNPDFAALATAFGAHGEVVSATEELAPALQRALDSGKPAVLELRFEPSILSLKGI